MSSKSQLNKMSKRDILNSIMQQQYQDSATTHRLLISLARTVGVQPEDLAKQFVDQDGNREFAASLNQAMDAAFANQQPKQGGATEALESVDSQEELPS